MEEDYLEIFPELEKDNHFEITSRQDIKYNCIAWAAFYDDRWMWPPGGYTLDGVVFYWPEGIEKNEKIETFINAFESLGYSICEDSDYENGYRKIALYTDEEGNCTHAARQKNNGLWTSKLGREHDIAHGNPYSIQGGDYGKVACILRKEMINL